MGALLLAQVPDAAARLGGPSHDPSPMGAVQPAQAPTPVPASGQDQTHARPETRDDAPAHQAADPRRVLMLGGHTVVIDASTARASIDGRWLHQPQGVVDGAAIAGLLCLVQRNGVALLFGEPPAQPQTDDRPALELVQRLEGLGQGVAAVVADESIQRLYVLAAGSRELFAIALHAPDADRAGRCARAGVHRPRPGAGHAGPRPRAGARRRRRPGPGRRATNAWRWSPRGRSWSCSTLDRSYRVLSRADLPDGLRRVESLAYTGSRWVLAGMDERAQPVLLNASSTAGPWQDLGAGVVDAALADQGQPEPWLPGGLQADGGTVHLTVRGGLAAVVRWPASSASLTPPGPARASAASDSLTPPPRHRAEAALACMPTHAQAVPALCHARQADGRPPSRHTCFSGP
ncbi:MAG: hypothetical protein KatS3mg103_0643 [Phycisphaerales bacterium]|nr:MAG: hypothetical protein KatS3mg103_0643 [Phycisphaerales bacterium]